MTVHEKTKHIIAQKMILELRVPWPLMMFELPMVQDLPSLRDISKSVRGSTILNIAEKRNRRLLRSMNWACPYTCRLRDFN